jgi:hypothetical protein
MTLRVAFEWGITDPRRMILPVRANLCGDLMLLAPAIVGF